jgi:hypothetical protein
VRILSIAVAAAAPAILVATFLLGSTADDEEFRWGVLSTFLHVRALAEGRLLAWTSTLGLGMPQPMVPNFHLHPLAPLLLAVSAVTWIRLLYAAHTIVGALGMWHLGRTLQLTPLTRAVCVFTFLLATPTQNYALTDFWPSHYVMWTSAPWLLLIAWKLLESDGREMVRLCLLLGFVGGLVLATTHPGHAPVYAVVAAAIAAAQGRAMVARWHALLAAAAIALAIAGPNLLLLATERAVFEPDKISKLTDPLPPSAVEDVFLRPFNVLGDDWAAGLIAGGSRVPFFGGPFTALSLVGVLWLGKRHGTLALGVVIGALVLFTETPPITFVSRYQFRDPLLLCAIPLAGLAADRLLRARRTRALAALALALQIGVVGAAIVPFVAQLWNDEGRPALQARGATGATPLADRLMALMPAPGRVAYTPQVEASVSERGLLRDGLGVNALAYRGVPVVNGSFKGISTDVLWPDDRLFYGRVRLPRQVVQSDDALDVLSVRYVVATPGEAVAAGLRERGTVPTRSGATLLLYENPDAPSGALLVDGPAHRRAVLPVIPDCVNDRLLCRDLAVLARGRSPDRADVTRRAGDIDVAVPRAGTERLLVVAEMFRLGWAASSDGRSLPIVSVGPGLLGVALPAGATRVQLRYGDAPLAVASLLSWGAIAAALLGLVISGRWRRAVR